MNRRLFARRFLLTCIILLLLAFAWVAITGGVRQFPRSNTLGQQVETIVQLAGGLLTLLVVFTCFWSRKWAAPIQVAWGISLVLTAGLSALVWGPPMPLVALGFAAGALLVAFTTKWALRRLSAGDVDDRKQPDHSVSHPMDAA